MLALGAWYTSGTFWSAAGAAAAIIFGALGAWATLYAAGLWQRLLVYGTNCARSLRTSATGGAAPPELQVSYGHETVRDAHLISLVIECRSRKDIRGKDFDGNRPLVFNLDARIIAIFAAAVDGSQIDAGTVARFDGTDLLVGPTLLRRGKPLTLDVLTDGPPRISYRAGLGPLTQVKVKERQVVERAVRRNRRLAISSATMAIVIATALISARLASGKPAFVPHHAARSHGASTPPVATVTITSPNRTVRCQPNRPQCRFEVAGRSTGVTSNMDIYVLVFPIRPGGTSGYGWYIQQYSASFGANGQWTESPAYLGSHTAPVCTGDTLQIEAIVVQRAASYQGTPLSKRAHQVRPIPNPRQIKGLIAQSKIVPLTAERQTGSPCSRAP